MEGWYNLALCIAVGMWPLMGAAGLAIGRMQVTDEIDRGESPTYERRRYRRHQPLRELRLR